MQKRPQRTGWAGLLNKNMFISYEQLREIKDSIWKLKCDTLKFDDFGVCSEEGCNILIHKDRVHSFEIVELGSLSAPIRYYCPLHQRTYNKRVTRMENGMVVTKRVKYTDASQFEVDKRGVPLEEDKNA